MVKHKTQCVPGIHVCPAIRLDRIAAKAAIDRVQATRANCFIHVTNLPATPRIIAQDGSSEATQVPSPQLGSAENRELQLVSKDQNNRKVPM